MSTTQHTIKVLAIQPDIPQGCRVTSPVYSYPESDQANATLRIKLEYVAAVIEGFIAVRSPSNLTRVSDVGELLCRQSRVRGPIFFAIDCSSKSINYGARFAVCERGYVGATTADSPLYFIKRDGKQSGFRFVYPIAVAINQNG